MKKIFLIFLVMTQILYGQNCFANADIWNKCIEDFQDAQSGLFDVALGRVDQEKTMIFRNGKNFAKEELNIFYKGRFWKAPLDIDSKFYDKKTLLLRLGSDQLCFHQAFNFILKDTSKLIAYNQSTCKHDAIVTMSENTEENKPSAEQVLETKMKKDLDLNIKCITEYKKNCGEQNIASSTAKLQKWKMQNCALLNRPVLEKLMSARNAALGLPDQVQSNDVNGIASINKDAAIRRANVNSNR